MDSPLLVFTTDFGLSDSYAGVMKGVALSINPKAEMVDLTHQIAPQDLAQAAFVLATSYRYFPSYAVHVVVVDPGVGTERRPVAVVTPHGWFVGPDNGVFTDVLSDYTERAPQTPGLAPLPPEVSAVHLTNSKYWRHPVSNTFHGRDIFAPVGAHLSLGTPLEQLGDPIGELFWLALAGPEFDGETIRGQVVYRDHFGNLVTNISGDSITQSMTESPAESMASPATPRVEVKGHAVHGLSRTFADGGQAPVAFIGSHGYLEIAMPNGNAALLLGVGPGEPVTVNFY